MIKPSVFTRVIVLTLTSALTLSATLAQQDISGGAGSLLAGAEVEAKLGKGIFTPAQNRTHAAKPLEKKTVTRSAHTSRQTTAGNRQGNNSGRGSNRNTNTGSTNTGTTSTGGRTTTPALAAPESRKY